MPVWWNWQTPGIQNPVSARTCGFDPRHRHQNKDSSSYWNPLIFPCITRKNRLKNVIAYLSKFKRITVNEQIRNYAQIPVTGAHCAPAFCAESAFCSIIVNYHCFNKIMPRIMTRNYTCAPRISCTSKKANPNILSNDLVRFLYSELPLRQLRFLRHWPRQRSIHRVTRFPPDPSRECRDAPPGWKRRSACAFCRTDAVG